MDVYKWLYPGIGIKRWILLILLGFALIISGLLSIIGTTYFVQYIQMITKIFILFDNKTTILLLGIISILFGIILLIYSARRFLISIIEHTPLNNNEKLLDIMYERHHLKKGPKIVVIGGGTGLSVLLRGLKDYTENITAIVTVSDDGGSSGILRGEMGILPPGDIRNCLIALADTEPLMKELFQYRFKTGTLKDHCFGNLFIAAMTDVTGDFQQAVNEFSKVLAVGGNVIPATLEDIVLYAETEEGAIIQGESSVSKGETPIKRVFIEPPNVRPVKEALDAIKGADGVIIGPGSLYTSIMPNLLIEDITNEIRKTLAYKIFVTNVMTEKGETNNFTASDHIKLIDKYFGSDIFDCILINTGNVPNDILERYKAEGAEPVIPDLENTEHLGKDIISGDFISKEEFARHDSEKLARKIVELVVENSCAMVLV